MLGFSLTRGTALGGATLDPDEDSFWRSENKVSNPSRVVYDYMTKNALKFF